MRMASHVVPHTVEMIANAIQIITRSEILMGKIYRIPPKEGKRLDLETENSLVIFITGEDQ
jgi:hypothetical protein